MVAADNDTDPIDDSERARIQRRDRKRRPRMVVDNAGVRRVMTALAWRRRSQQSHTQERGSGS